MKVKSEKHTMNDTLKIKHEECKGLIGKAEALILKNDELQRKLELSSTKIEYRRVEKDYITAKREIEDLKLRITEVSKVYRIC